MKFLKTLIKTTPIIIIILYTFVYSLACLSAYINPIHFKYFTFLSLAFPYLLIGMIPITIASFLLYKKKGFFVLLVLLAGYKNIFSTIGFHSNKEFSVLKQPQQFRVLSWNVCEFIDNQVSTDNYSSPRRKMLRYIKNTQPDILCLQDFKNHADTAEHIFFSNIKYITDTLKYPYYYFSVDNFPACTNFYVGYYGTIIFSKFPIIDSGKIAYDFIPETEHLAYATVNIHGKKVRIYNTHLHSMYLKADGREPKLDPRELNSRQNIYLYRSKMQTIRYYDSIHVQQAKMIQRNVSTCKLPFVFCADLNSVPSSYTYQTISKSLKDPFLKHGGGWGQTYSSISPTLRIDVILHNSLLQSIQYHCPPFLASDHYTVITDLQVQ